MRRLTSHKPYFKTNDKGYHCEDGPAVVNTSWNPRYVYEFFYLNNLMIGHIKNDLELAEATFVLNADLYKQPKVTEEKFFEIFNRAAAEYKMSKVLER